MWMQWLAAGGFLTAIALRLVAQHFDRPNPKDRQADKAAHDR